MKGAAPSSIHTAKKRKFSIQVRGMLIFPKFRFSTAVSLSKVEEIVIRRVVFTEATGKTKFRGPCTFAQCRVSDTSDGVGGCGGRGEWWREVRKEGGGGVKACLNLRKMTFSDTLLCNLFVTPVH